VQGVCSRYWRPTIAAADLPHRKIFFCLTSEVIISSLDGVGSNEGSTDGILLRCPSLAVVCVFYDDWVLGVKPLLWRVDRVAGFTPPTRLPNQGAPVDCARSWMV